MITDLFLLIKQLNGDIILLLIVFKQSAIGFYLLKVLLHVLDLADFHRIQSDSPGISQFDE